MHKRLRISCTNLPQLPGRRMQSGTIPITLNDTDMKSGKIMVIGSSNTDMTVFTQRHPEPGKAGAAISYALGQGAPMVAAIWGVFIWKEFKGASKGVYALLAVMFLLFVSGLGLIIASGY